MNNDELRQTLIEVGLLEHVVRFDNYGYFFDWSETKQESMFDDYGGFRNIVISLPLMATVAAMYGIPECDVLQSMVAHEIGHAEAHRTASDPDSDWIDEEIAWDNAESLFPNGLSENWYALKNHALSCSAYHWYLGRTPMSEEEVIQYSEQLACPNCGKDSGHLMEIMAISANTPPPFLDQHIACIACGSQFRTRRKNGKLIKMWRLSSDDYLYQGNVTNHGNN